MDDLRLDPVRYTFGCLDSPDPGWHVRRIRWTEGISVPYQLIIELITEYTDTDTDTLLGSSVELLMERSGFARTAYGVVHRVDDLGVAREQLSVRIHVVPALALLRHRVDTRIFQGLTVPEIIEQVLEAGLVADRELDVSSCLSGRYEVRDCCVQFRESDFDFCSRLMEEEGIAYFFEPDDDNRREKLILIDSNDAYADVPLALSETVPIIPDRYEDSDRESLQALTLTRTQRFTKLSTRGFNWKIPTTLDEGEEGGSDERGEVRELYLVDDHRQIIDDPINDSRGDSFTGEQLEQRVPLAVKRLELFRSSARRLNGRGNVISFMSGQRFTLEDHSRLDLAQTQLLLISVTHLGSDPSIELGADAGDSPVYTNEFECAPIEIPFRPEPRTPRPRVLGAQTAIVMGPSDNAIEDIHTDPHGRVKVRFHWDRLSPEDATASCWVRVAQTWAGRGWGTMFIPRVGMEVVVDFLDGNPDRPLIVGCVYNGDHPPPYTLPDEKTKSTIKSDSSPGGGGFNELRFEDAKGDEEVFLHAQKDFNETVLNNHSTSVGANQSNTVAGDQSESIGGQQTLSVDKNRSVTIIGSQSVTIQGAEAADGVSGSKLGITGDYKVDASNTVEIQAPTHIKLTCGGSTITMVPGKITLSAGGAAELVLDANALMHSAAGSKIFLDANALAQSSGGSKVLLDANALAQSSGGSKVLLDANALMSSPGTGTVQAPTATLAGGGGSVEAGGAGVTCAGGQVNVSGGMVNVSGGMVKIN